MYITFDEIMDYKRQIEKLQAENNNLINKNIELIKERDRLMSQVGSNSNSSSSTHTHTKGDRWVHASQ